MIRSFVKSSFFRQSAWLSFATFAGGGAMMFVQIIAGRIKIEGELSLFNALLDLVTQMAIPTLGVQAALAYMTAHAESETARKDLAANMRAVLSAILMLWFIAGIGGLLFRHRLALALDISNPMAIPLTLLAGLVAMVTPVTAGVVQGKQDFLWYGWGTLLNGVARLAGVAGAVLVLHGGAAGAIFGVLLGSGCALAILAWRTRDVFLLKGGRADLKFLLRQIIPVSLMVGAPTFLFTFDSNVVKRFFDSPDLYVAARTIGRTLVFITAPMVYVMLPKIIQSTARSERSNVLAQTLGVTAFVGAIAATAATIVPWLPLKILYGAKYLHAAPFVPWFAWCMLPLAIGNVLVNSLLARGKFAVIPWLILVAVGYGVTLQFYHPTLLSVVQMLGVFGVLLILVCLPFTRTSASAATPARPASA